MVLLKWLLAGTLFVTFNPALLANASKTGKLAVVHLKHFTDDLHAAKMALGFANEFIRQGAQTTLVLSLEGVRLVDKSQPINMTWGMVAGSDAKHAAGHEHGASTHNIEAQYESFVKAGGKVLACPHCAASVGCEIKRLRDGAKFSSMEEMAAALLAADVVLDY